MNPVAQYAAALSPDKDEEIARKVAFVFLSPGQLFRVWVLSVLYWLRNGLCLDKT